MNFWEGIIKSKIMTRKLFYGLPRIDIEPKNEATIHRERFSFKIREGMFIDTEKGLKLVLEIFPNGNIKVDNYFVKEQIIRQAMSESVTIHHSDVNEPFDCFISGQKERQELIEKLKK